MHLIKLNDTRKIGRKIGAIDDYKELTTAIASGNIACIGNLLKAGLANHAGVRGLVGLTLHARIGKARAAHDAASRAMGLRLLRLGGARVAEIGAHQVLMLDEIATERRVRYDDRNNKVVSVCGQHGHKVPLVLDTEADLKVLCDGLKKGDAHLAREATVAALGALSENPREYSAHPILFSADCKHKRGVEHAKMILCPLVTAINNKSEHRNTKFHLEYMKKPLSPDSPIYSQLSSLELMNLLVGDDDVTYDKDFKHVIKCLRGLTMHDAGIEVLGFLITVSILRQHLLANGLTAKKNNSYLNPNNTQDVPLLFSLLRAIWSLPPAPVNAPPIFARARTALRMFGRLAYNIVMPYICIDMRFVSTTAHLLLDLYLLNDACGRFMPSQMFVNLMIMIKNVFFCVAKAKVNTPNGKFWLILLGADRLEVFFGLIRMAIGMDANVDLLQLASCGTNSTEVQVILSMHPEWDRTLRRIKLPAIASTGELDSKVDHIDLASCTGNLYVSSVNCLTCWQMGRCIAEEIISGSAEQFKRLARLPGVDILAPYRMLMVNNEVDDETDSSFLVESEPSYLGDGDLEDTLGVEEPRSGFDSYIQIGGQRITKAKPTGITESETSILGALCLRIDNPITMLVRCKDQLFLAIGSVTSLSLGSQSFDEINLPLLADVSAQVSFQIMQLVRATMEDDPSECMTRTGPTRWMGRFCVSWAA
ncbi:hypothetical protein K438DRAFT_1906886 [Mycena galopus ATCC 62051]|nr:hypothetical protein K438DRAFT_1906886 [Mycena galopus ATCC 62051]